MTGKEHFYFYDNKMIPQFNTNSTPIQRTITELGCMRADSLLQIPGLQELYAGHIQTKPHRVLDKHRLQKKLGRGCVCHNEVQ